MIETPFGEIAVADAHVHFFSHRFFELLAGQAGLTLDAAASRLGWIMPPPDPAELARTWAAELDRHGVDRSVLIASLPGDHGSVAEAIRELPDRFAGYFMLNPLAPDAEAVASSALDAGLRGICLFPAMHGYSLHGDAVIRILEIARKRPGAIVFTHCGVLTVGVRKKLGMVSRFDLRYSNPVDVHGLAMRYPSLPFVIPHFGAGYLREALMVCGLCPNVYLDTSSTNSWMVFEGHTLRGVFERALAVAGPDRLLFGTDSSFFPRGWIRAAFDEQVRVLAEIGVAAEDARKVLGGNLVRLISAERVS